MSLELIAGPPNSGRAGAVLSRLEAAIAAEPLLVVPTSDDVDRFERELAEHPAAMLGATVTTFPGLFGEAARCYGIGAGEPLSRIQRIWLARRATAEADLGILRRSARSEGFAPALEALLDDLGAAGLDAAGFAALLQESEDSGRYEAEIAELFAAYERLRTDLGCEDEHLQAAAAIAALRSDPGRWRERPVYLYGFDDLARQQIELLAGLSEAAEVTVALAYEPRNALDARAELLGVLRDELGGEIVAELAPDSSYTESATLFHLERNLFEADPETAACDDSLSLLEAAGERGEAELLGRRIAALIASGVDADEIAIAVRSPDRQAPILARVLASLGIQVAAEARVPLTTTATGSALMRLLAIFSGTGTAADVVAFLRGPARARAASVDWLERRVRRSRLETAAEALEAWRGEKERKIWALDELESAAGDPEAIAEAIGWIASDIAERPHLRQGPQPSGGPAIELRAAAEVRRAVSETAALGRLAPALDQIAELLGLLRVPLWRGPTEGRVRILSPYRLRASRVSHLFVAGLTDGSFPSPAGQEPLLSDQRRRALALPARRDPAAEERYLFYACVSRPERSLQLSYPAADESGAALARSPFVDEIRALLDPPPTPDPATDELERRITDRIGIGEIAPLPERASNPRALARALAALDPEQAATRAAALRIPDQVRAEASDRVDGARERVSASAAPGPLNSEAVLAELGRVDLFGASTLEEYDLCSYRWFVNHELNPRSIEPDPEPLENGGIVHHALEELYRHPPQGSRPDAGSLEAWQTAARVRVREAAAERDWEMGSGRARIALARFDAVLDRFLAREAATGGPMVPDPALLEVAFGAGPEDHYPPADLGDFKLHGKIDRIDVSTDRKALIRDYKLSSKVVAAKKLLDEGRLQLPLYMAAVRGMGLEPIGGLYHPLAATREDRPRGLLAKDHKDTLIPGETAAHYGTDFLDQESFDEIVERGVERAGGIVAGIRSGRVLRDPREGSCPSWCGFAPICRMERGVTEPDEDDEEQR